MKQMIMIVFTQLKDGDKKKCSDILNEMYSNIYE